jgi:YVTN family beta-propeller protein
MRVRGAHQVNGGRRRGPAGWRRAVTMTVPAAVPLAASVAAAVPASAAVGYAVTATIPVGSAPFGVAADPITHTVYVANGGYSTVSVIDTATNTVTDTITLGTDPTEVVADPAAGKIYVAGTDGTVSVIDTATNTVTDTITVGASPDGVAVNPMTYTAYVANFADNTVSVISRGRAPAITSAPAYTATIGKPMHLVITATGYPAPTVTESGALPCGLHFISTRNGHAAIVGIPGKGMAGRYPLTITATNQFGATSESFVLTVRRPVAHGGHGA